CKTPQLKAKSRIAICMPINNMTLIGSEPPNIHKSMMPRYISPTPTARTITPTMAKAILRG
ncbi:MAG: hypothetical protein V1850_00815, partial [Candidatus Bathyarchaeota archaeon]